MGEAGRETNQGRNVGALLQETQKAKGLGPSREGGGQNQGT